jgi:hypothetical protein
MKLPTAGETLRRSVRDLATYTTYFKDHRPTRNPVAGLVGSRDIEIAVTTK